MNHHAPKAAADIFAAERAAVGMIHMGPSPGSPSWIGQSTNDLIDAAVRDARALADARFDAVILENMHDTPYLLRTVGPEVTATLAVVAAAVRDALPAAIPLGVQVLAGANTAALAVALASGATFIRAEGFAYAAIADEGLLAEADAGNLLRERARLRAHHIAILADIKKKHSSHAITADLNIAETAHGCSFMGADGLIVTGATTGAQTSPDDLRAARNATNLPLAVGSGATPDNAQQLLDTADALIVGSWIKAEGNWKNAVDPQRATAFVKACK